MTDLIFEYIHDNTKTAKWLVFAPDNTKLGTIRYSKVWKGFCFAPEVNILLPYYNLSDIANFCSERTQSAYIGDDKV